MSGHTLKPCPFCGGQAKTTTGKFGIPKKWQILWGVYCDGDCGTFFDCREPSEAKAVAAWNERHIENDMLDARDCGDDMGDLYDSLKARGCIHPKLFHVMFVSMIGGGCPFPTIKAAADHFGVHPEQFRQFIRGKRSPEPKLLEAFGYEKITLFAPVAKAQVQP